MKQDPFRIYKAGEDSRLCHGVDFSGWAANGWSETPDQPVDEPQPVPIIVPHDLTVPRKTKRTAT